MTIKQELTNILDILNSSIDDLSKLMNEKLKNDEMAEYRKLKVVYDKLKGTV